MAMENPCWNIKKPAVGKTYPVESPLESDEFNTDTLGLQWQWHANPQLQWSASMRGSDRLRLFAWLDSARNLWAAPNLLLQKFPAPSFTATARLTYHVDSNAADNKKAGLLIMGSDYSYLAISKNKDGYMLSQVICKDANNRGPEETVEQVPLQGATVFLRVKVAGPDAGCIFSYSEDGNNFKNIGKPFTAKEGRWIGAKVGLFCTGKSGGRIGGYADVDWVRITQ